VAEEELQATILSNAGELRRAKRREGDPHGGHPLDLTPMLLSVVAAARRGTALFEATSILPAFAFPHSATVPFT